MMISQSGNGWPTGTAPLISGAARPFFLIGEETGK